MNKNQQTAALAARAGDATMATLAGQEACPRCALLTALLTSFVERAYYSHEAGTVGRLVAFTEDETVQQAVRLLGWRPV